MNRVLKVIIISFLIILIFPVILIMAYYTYLKIDHYVITGSVEVEKIASIAIEKKDSSICGKIRKGFLGVRSEEDLQDECYNHTAEGLLDITICESMSRDSYKPGCYLNMAKVLSDESACRLTGVYTGVCYGYIAQQKKDVKICDNVSDESFRNRCYLELNKIVGDMSICENKVHITKDKDHCYYGVLLSFFQRGKPLTVTEKQICEKISPGDTKNECLQYYSKSIMEGTNAHTPENTSGMYQN